MVTVRLFSVPGYREGGLVHAAEAVRRGGRGKDEVLLHMTPEEFEWLQGIWGAPDINPNTGLPEYGFLSDVFDKVKKFGKRLLKHPAVQLVAPVAMNALLPGVGGLAANALFRGASAGAMGGDPLKGALHGAMGSAMSRGLPGAGGSTAANLDAGAGAGTALGSEAMENAMHGIPPEAAGGSGPLAGLRNFFTRDSGSPAWGKIAGAGLGALALGNAMGSRSGETAQPPNIHPEGWNDPLPELDFNRDPHGMREEDYFSYGTRGGEHDFFGANQIPSTSPQGQAGPGGPPIDPSRIPDPESLDWDQMLGEYGFDFDKMAQLGLISPGMADEMRRKMFMGIGMAGMRDGGLARGPGTGRSDDIDARLSDGEYVVDAETVALLGDGSVDAGSRRLDEMRRNLRKHKAQNFSKGEFSHQAKEPEVYMSKGGRIRGDWVRRVIDGGKKDGRPKMTEEERIARLRHARRMAEALRERKKDEAPPEKAKGGRISKGKSKPSSRRSRALAELKELARKLESMIESREESTPPSLMTPGRHDASAYAQELERLSPSSEVLRQWRTRGNR